MGFVPASSVIFVVIVALWAVFLLKLWSRRRANGAAARSVDGYTEAMRVLEKRRVLPSSELPERRSHSHAVTPAAAAASGRRSPLVARRSSHEDPATNGTRHEVESMSTARATVPAQRAQGAPRRVSRAQRLLRAALLLVSLLWVPVSVALAVTGVLLWASVPLSVLTLVAVLVWLRTEARADRARRAGPRRAGRPTAPASEPRLSSDDTQVIREPQRYAVSPADAADPATTGEPATTGAGVAAGASSAAYAMVFDVEATEAATQQPAEPPAPGTWSPVPVPTPTYAMKAKAEPRYTENGIPADVFDTPEFADEVDELDDRALFARRAASQ